MRTVVYEAAVLVGTMKCAKTREMSSGIAKALGVAICIRGTAGGQKGDLWRLELKHEANARSTK